MTRPTRCAHCLAPFPDRNDDPCAFCGAARDAAEDEVELLFEDERVRVSEAYLTNVRDGRVLAIDDVRSIRVERPGTAVPGFLAFVAAFVAWATLFRWAPDSTLVTLVPLGLGVVGLLALVFGKARLAALVAETDEGVFRLADRVPPTLATEIHGICVRAMERRAARAD